MTEDQNTKDLSDRELLELMRREMNVMRQGMERIEVRLGELEARTNPLPPNYDARFTALESDIREIKRDMRQLRDHDWKRERELADMNERVERLEDHAA
jgi:chromosome segregation ATPase